MNVTEKYLTVTALTRYIKRKFELDQHLTTVWLKGEISNFKHHSRGHMYFTLKDEQSKILAVMFAGYNRSLRFVPENGMDVIIKGEVSVYEAMGQYQLYVHDMIPDGVGALNLAFEQLKERLEREGLFDQAKKRLIRSFPEHIGIITSPTGAAIQDILSTINRRFPSVKISIFPSLVQGDQAKDDIVKKIALANLDLTIDHLIIARGGGSIEELWPFNEEVVARAVATSKIPIISGVGHETDTTIVDFVADLRAPTPTAAAELAVPLQTELTAQVLQTKRTLTKEFNGLIKRKRERLSYLQANYAFQYPKQLIAEKDQQLDRLVDTLERNINQQIQRHKETLHRSSAQLKLNSPKHRVTVAQQKVEFLTQTLDNHFQQLFNNKLTRFDHYLNQLHLLSPLNTMKRGYSIGYDQTGAIIKSVKQVNPKDKLTLKLSDGIIDSQIITIKEDEHD